MPNIMSWTTYKKKFNPVGYQVQDGSLGIVYKVEPTMRNAGFRLETMNGGFNDFGIPRGIYSDEGFPKEQVKKFVKDNHLYKKCTLIVYYVWHVRRESTMLIDIFSK